MPLNDTLYDALHKAFHGDIKIANEGYSGKVRYRYDAKTGRYRDCVIDWGESYQVCCPFCGDGRYRLYVNYRWGVRDTKTGYSNWTYFKCFNEECQSDPDYREQLRDLVYGVFYPTVTEDDLNDVTTIVTTSVTVPPGPIEIPDIDLPGDVVALDELASADHPVLTMLRDRGFDLDQCTNQFAMGYSSGRNRLIVPILRDQHAKGWQGRYIELPGQTRPKEAPKWLTAAGTKISHLLYNQDQAKDWPFVVVVEGIFDVLGVGSPQGRTQPGPAVASFGKHLSAAQIEIVKKYWPNQPVLLMYDADCWEQTYQLTEKLRSEHQVNALPIPLPDKQDPASMPHDQLWQLIELAKEPLVKMAC